MVLPPPRCSDVPPTPPQANTTLFVGGLRPTATNPPTLTVCCTAWPQGLPADEKKKRMIEFGTSKLLLALPPWRRESDGPTAVGRMVGWESLTSSEYSRCVLMDKSKTAHCAAAALPTGKVLTLLGDRSRRLSSSAQRYKESYDLAAPK